MRTGGLAAFARTPYRLTAVHRIAHTYRQILQMCIPGFNSIAMVDLDDEAATDRGDKRAKS